MAGGEMALAGDLQRRGAGVHDFAEHSVDLPDLVVPLGHLCANGCVRYMMCGTKEMINPV